MGLFAAFPQLPKLAPSPTLTAVIVPEQLHPADVPHIPDSSSFLALTLEELFSQSWKSILDTRLYGEGSGGGCAARMINHHTRTVSQMC